MEYGNRPTLEFGGEAVRLALTGGRTRRELAVGLGIGLSTLTRWLSRERDVSEPSEAPDGAVDAREPFDRAAKAALQAHNGQRACMARRAQSGGAGRHGRWP